MKEERPDDCGVGLVAAVALLSIVAMSAALLAPAVFQLVLADNSAKTAAGMEELKMALVGNPRLINEGGRADFGLIGTMGNVPAQLSQLWNGAGLPAYQFNTSKKVGHGWAGPYIPRAFVEDLLAMDKDAFGNPLTYTTAPFTRTSDNQTVAVRIGSGGADGITGTADDFTLDVLYPEIYSTVTGRLLKGSTPVAFATVTLNQPQGGNLGQAIALTDYGGVFTFDNVTFGFRSVSIDPRLTYEPDSATVQGGNTVKFTVTNYGASAATITSLTATYNTAAWYEKIRAGNTDVFTWTTARAASGQTVAFNSSVTIGGSGKATQVVPVRVDKETTVTPDLLIRGAGKSLVIQLQNFKDKIDNAGGNAGAVNMSGTAFTINFSDGSRNTFVVP